MNAPTPSPLLSKVSIKSKELEKAIKKMNRLSQDLDKVNCNEKVFIDTAFLSSPNNSSFDADLKHNWKGPVVLTKTPERNNKYMPTCNKHEYNAHSPQPYDINKIRFKKPDPLPRAQANYFQNRSTTPQITVNTLE